MPKLFALVVIPLLLAVGCGGGGSSALSGNTTPTDNLTCTAEEVTLAEQLQNPVTLFAKNSNGGAAADDNGVILEIPSVPTTGATSPTGGVIVFGIGTESNNSLGSSVTLLQSDPETGNLTGYLNGTSYANGYFDSGSNANFITDSALTVCASPNQGFYCPQNTVSENASMQGTNNANPVPTDFSVANANTLFNNDTSGTAFDNLAGPNSDSTSLDLGFPFFYGENIYTGIEPASGASPPYFALIANTTAGGSAAIATSGAPNVEPVVIDAGPSGLSPPSVNTPFISVTICVPGTNTCQTIDHVEVDTGSIGLRLISGQVSVSLPAVMDSSNNPLAECLQFADGTTWGSVVSADITLPTSGESAKGVNVQLIGASSVGNPPSACTGTAENSVSSFGANGIIGVGPFINDCNASGECAPGSQSANYYYCTG